MAKLTKQFLEKAKELKELKAAKLYGDDDCKGLYLKARPSGTHSWIYKARFEGKLIEFTIGQYKDIPLAKARELARSYNEMKALGKNPKIEKENIKLKDKDYFINTAQEYLDYKHPDKPYGFKSMETYKKSLSYYNRILLPTFKDYKLSDIKRVNVKNTIKDETPNTQDKLKNLISQIFEYAIDRGITENNPAIKVKTDPIITDGFEFVNPVDDVANFSKLMNAISDFKKGDITTVRAIQLTPYIALRPGNIVSLKWTYFDEKNKLLVIPGEEMKMKGRPPYKQPLSKQAFDIIMQMKPITQNREYIFHSTRSKHNHIVNANLSKALKKKMKFNGIDNPEQDTHGFRKSVRTYISSIKSKHGWDRDSVRMILSHLKDDKVDEIYDKNQFIQERREMLQLWADYIDHVKENANVIRMEDIG